MGKGKRLRAQRQGELEKRRSQPQELAPEPVRPPSPDDAGGGRLSSYARWEIGKHVYAWMILLSYLELAIDGPGVPADLLAPQGASENDEEFAARRTSAQLHAEVDALAGSPAEQVAEVLSWVAPSQASAVVENLAAEGIKHLNASGANWPDPAEWQAGARPLIGALCPAAHWNAALEQLDTLAASQLAVTGEIITRGIEHPVATIHAIAALVTWLHGRSDIVADPAAARLELAEQSSKLGEFIF
ncbi:hypothetical protein GCM10010430_44470 [Kitasatospora cystarginea]|uniref:Uncharacterized protein n=1 Tax=Kitasatospora cystarginea TaxID=58350 RepID=A0ABP5RA19_9ACTN